MGPTDYSAAFAGYSPNAAFDGFKQGAAVQQMQVERAAAQKAAADKAAMQAELATLSQNPTTQGIAALSIKYPQLSEGFKRSFDMLEPGEKTARLESATPVYMALHNDKPDIATKLLKDQATAYRNAGKEQEAKAAEAKAQQIADDPVAAKINLGGLLSAVIGPDKFTTMLGQMGVESRAAELQPSAVKEAAAKADGAQADATAKGVTAKYAEQNALADYEKKGWDIKKVQADIVSQRETNRIAAMNAAYNREGNELKRQELKLKIGDAVRERDEKVRGKIADVESAAGNIDNMLNTIARIEKNPSLNSVVGSLEGKSLYPNAALGTVSPFGDGDERSDAIALIETLGSQAFLAQIPNIKGMGALSNAEGEKLQSAFQNLSRTQSEAQFRATLKEATRLLNKGRETVGKRYGVPMGAPDTPAASKPQAAAIPQGWTVQER